MDLSIYTLSDIYTGDAYFLSSALYYNTIIYTNVYYTARFTHTRFTLAILYPTTLPHTLFTQPRPYFLTSYIKMCNFVYIFFFSLPLYICNGSNMYKIRYKMIYSSVKYFDIVVSKLIIINKPTPFKWLYALKRSFCFTYSLRT